MIRHLLRGPGLVALLASFLLLLAAACNGEPSAKPSLPATVAPTSTPRATAVPRPTRQPSATPGVPREATPSPSPVSTAVPTSGLTGTAAPTPTVGDNPIATAIPTPTPVLEPQTIPVPPLRDLYELARALVIKSSEPLPPVTYDDPVILAEGHRESFNVLNPVAVRSDSIDATLKLTSDNAYWFVEDGLSIDREGLEKAAREFEARIYPVVTSLFGSLWPEGAAQGNRITILNARLRGVAGYYSSADEYPIQVHPLSNERKMIYMNSSFLPVGSGGYLQTLAHELQHAVHWNVNGGQSTWLNEGLSLVAEARLGYVTNTMNAFANSPPTSLVYWPLSTQDSTPNYGAAFLFSQFLSTQYDLEELIPLVATGALGIGAVDSYLEGVDAEDNFASLFGRWVVTNYLGHGEHGPFSNPGHGVTIRPTDVLERFGALELSQPQYSARYLRLDLDEDQATIYFRGSDEVFLLPSDPPSGGHCWWGNRGDSISTTLTREFDLWSVEEATLSFRLWYEIEEDWDYGYVQVSTDGGVTWDILQGTLATPRNPVGNSFGPGYSGLSDGWVEDQVDLTPYAGQMVLVRFHYVTDDAINGTGLCLDQVSIPEIGFFDDASQNQGWESRGFFRTNNRLPQEYVVWVVESRDGESTVRPLELDDENGGRLLVQGLSSTDEVVVIVGSLARGSSQPAQYLVILE